MTTFPLTVPSRLALGAERWGAERCGIERLGGADLCGVTALGGAARGVETLGTFTVDRVVTDRVSRRGAALLLGRGAGLFTRSELELTRGI